MKNAVLDTCADTVIGEGVLLFNDRIVKMGGEGDIPADAVVIDAQGQRVTPGLIDAHTHLGVYGEGVGWAGEDGNEASEPVTAEVRALDAIDPFDRAFREALEAGVTTVMIAPGSANPVAGLCSVCKTSGTDIRAMLVRPHAGLKVAFGENPKHAYGDQHKAPMTRMGIAALIRKTFVRAQHYLERRERGCDDERDLGLEHVGCVLQRRMPLRAHAHKASDIVAAFTIATEFQVDLIIEHGTEAYKIAPLLAEQKIPVVVGPLLTSRSKVELQGMTAKNAVLLQQAGVQISLMSDHPETPVQYLPAAAAICVREGMSPRQALALMTMSAAKILGLDQRIGSLNNGTDADLVVWNGDPLDLRSRPVLVFVNGRLVVDRRNG